RQRERRLVDAPHRPVRRDDEVGGEQTLVVANERVEARAADLLLALEHALDVDGQRAHRGKERFGNLDRQEHRALVVGDAARVDAAVAQCRRKGRALPLLQRIGRLDIIMSIYQNRHLARGAEPFAVDDRVAGGRHRADVERAGGGELGGHPAAGGGDVARVRGVGADARDRRELDQLVEDFVVLGLEPREHVVDRHHLPPSIERTCPVIQLASSDAKKRTPCVMSSVVPSRLTAMRSTSSRWPASPYASHCRSVAGLERTKPGAMLLTVIPHGPSSWASWRVSPICAAFADAYAWIPVRLTPRPAPLEMLTIRPERAAFIPGATACAQ